MLRAYWEAILRDEVKRPSKPDRAAVAPYFKWVVSAGQRASPVVGHSREAHAWAVSADCARNIADLMQSDLPRCLVFVSKAWRRAKSDWPSYINERHGIVHPSSCKRLIPWTYSLQRALSNRDRAHLLRLEKVALDCSKKDQEFASRLAGVT